MEEELSPGVDTLAASNSSDSDEEPLRYGDEEDELYDEAADQQDEAWLDKKYRQGLVTKPAVSQQTPANETAQSAQEQPADAPAKSTGKRKKKPTPFESDAQLSCPMCFTMVCTDCQRHCRYHTQFRAVFAMNVNIKSGEELAFASSGKPGQSKGLRASSGKAAEEDVYHPVCCQTCGVEVGVIDRDEVYHFFNVIASG